MRWETAYYELRLRLICGINAGINVFLLLGRGISNAYNSYFAVGLGVVAIGVVMKGSLVLVKAYLN